MNYQEHYDKIISKAKNRILQGYCEKHHIIPKCIGGNNSKENLVPLTPEEHFVAHQLLVKIYKGNPKLVYALHRMTSGTKSQNRNNKMYGWIRKAYSKVISERQKGKKQPSSRGKKHSETMKRKYTTGYINPKGFLGKNHTDEYKNIVRNRMKGDNNPRRKYPLTQKQLNTIGKFHNVGMEASKKPIKVTYADGSFKVFGSKRDVCKNLNISYDILNYRLKRNLSYNDMYFEELKNDRRANQKI